MKKIALALIAVLLLAGTLFAATSTRYVRYADIFRSRNFTLKGTSYTMENGRKTGDGYPLVVAEQGDSYYMEASENGSVVKVIISDGKYYMIDESSKSIIAMSMEGGDTDTDFIEFTDYAFEVLSSGNGKLDGKSLFYEKSINQDGDEYTCWYNGSTLAAIQFEDAIIYIDSLEQKVDSSLFVVPESGYEILDLTSLFSEMSEWDWSSEDYGDYDYDFGDYNYGEYWYDTTRYYYALGIELGLDESQAQAFDEAMCALDYLDWGELNRYYDESTGLYDLQGSTIEDICYVDDYTMERLQGLIDLFRR
ncbi:MAG: hypothetical protein IJ863_01720 [Spirochaetales bacterium]|nr:hypothetical protein [Spirochaetales bacterium]